MAYLRQHGNQLAIVQGERDQETGKVGQRVLFSLYSKQEALEALGKGEAGGRERFQSLLEWKYRDIRFNWQAIQEALEANLGVLPESYSYEEGRLNKSFRPALCAFARQLFLAEPQHALPAAQLIREHRFELEYLAKMIHFHLKQCEQQENEWNKDNKFYWRFETRRESVPPDVEEEVAELYERGELEKAEAVFQLLVESFDAYAEGHNYLGLIALKRDRLDEAIACFTRTMEVGRGLFPKRMARKRYWSDLSTRPYMRGMRNLALTLNRAGRYEDSLVICDRLEQECGDELTAKCHRASVYLNIGEWRKAAEAALYLHRIFPEESLLHAFALFELGLREEAMAAFLHGALNHPRAARMLAGLRSTQPKSHDEVEDHDTGVWLLRSLGGYWGQQRPAARQFFRQLVGHPSVMALLEETVEVVRKWHEERRPGERKAYDRMQLMRTPEFARERAGELAWLLESRNRRVKSAKEATAQPSATVH